MKHIELKVFGKVQGVFFRASTKKKADELKIFGTVRNLPDGTVYIEAEGDQDQLQHFVTWCSQGPANARVDKLDEKESDLKGYTSFEIVR